MKTSVNDILDSIFHERTSTPLYTSFIISWLLWNWDVVYITLFVSETRLPEGLTLYHVISRKLNWWFGLVFPAGSTALFIFLFPYAANYTYKKSLQFKKERLSLKADIIDKERLLTHEEAANLKNDAFAQEERMNKRISGLSTEREVLEVQLNKLRNENTARIELERKNFESFQVITAHYGAERSWIDVSQHVREFAEKDKEKLDLTVTNDFFGMDPVPGVLKILILTFSYRGTVDTVSAHEGGSIFIRFGGSIVIKDSEHAKAHYAAQELEMNRLRSIETAFNSGIRKN